MPNEQGVDMTKAAVSRGEIIRKNGMLQKVKKGTGAKSDDVLMSTSPDFAVLGNSYDPEWGMQYKKIGEELEKKYNKNYITGDAISEKTEELNTKNVNEAFDELLQRQEQTNMMEGKTQQYQDTGNTSFAQSNGGYVPRYKIGGYGSSFGMMGLGGTITGLGALTAAYPTGKNEGNEMRVARGIMGGLGALGGLGMAGAGLGRFLNRRRKNAFERERLARVVEEEQARATLAQQQHQEYLDSIAHPAEANPYVESKPRRFEPLPKTSYEQFMDDNGFPEGGSNTSMASFIAGRKLSNTDVPHKRISEIAHYNERHPNNPRSFLEPPGGEDNKNIQKTDRYLPEYARMHVPQDKEYSDAYGGSVPRYAYGGADTFGHVGGALTGLGFGEMGLRAILAERDKEDNALKNAVKKAFGGIRLAGGASLAGWQGHNIVRDAMAMVAARKAAKDAQTENAADEVINQIQEQEVPQEIPADAIQQQQIPAPAQASGGTVPRYAYGDYYGARGAAGLVGSLGGVGAGFGLAKWMEKKRLETEADNERRRITDGNTDWMYKIPEWATRGAALIGGGIGAVQSTRDIMAALDKRATGTTLASPEATDPYTISTTSTPDPSSTSSSYPTPHPSAFNSPESSEDPAEQGYYNLSVAKNRHKFRDTSLPPEQQTRNLRPIIKRLRELGYDDAGMDAIVAEFGPEGLEQELNYRVMRASQTSPYEEPTPHFNYDEPSDSSMSSISPPESVPIPIYRFGPRPRTLADSNAYGGTVQRYDAGGAPQPAPTAQNDPLVDADNEGIDPEIAKRMRMAKLAQQTGVGLEGVIAALGGFNKDTNVGRFGRHYVGAAANPYAGQIQRMMGENMPTMNPYQAEANMNMSRMMQAAQMTSNAGARNMAMANSMMAHNAMMNSAQRQVDEARMAQSNNMASMMQNIGAQDAQSRMAAAEHNAAEDSNIDKLERQASTNAEKNKLENMRMMIGGIADSANLGITADDIKTKSSTLGKTIKDAINKFAKKKTSANHPYYKYDYNSADDATLSAIIGNEDYDNEYKKQSNASDDLYSLISGNDGTDGNDAVINNVDEPRLAEKDRRSVSNKGPDNKVNKIKKKIYNHKRSKVLKSK